MRPVPGWCTTSIVAVGLLLMLAGCGESEKPPLSSARDWTLPVKTVNAGVPVEYTAIGSVISDRRVEVASRLSGYLLEVLVREGDQVHRGELLARIDASDVDSRIRQAQASLKSAQATYDDASVDLKHYQRLFRDGTISESRLRQVKLQHETALEARNQARAVLDAARAQSDYTGIRSPIDGVVVERLHETGDLAVPGMPLLALESGSDLVFQTYVTEQQIRRVGNAQSVTVQIDGLDGPLDGRVRSVVRSADPVTRSYPVKIALPDTPGLMSGMFGRADFVLGQAPVPVLPRKALVERGGLRGTFVVDADGTARFRWLRIGREWPDRVEVTAGLKAGERVVAASEPGLHDGDHVTAAESGQ